jgi:hypothetical protein
MKRLFVRAISLLIGLGLAAAPAGAQTPAPVEVSLAMNAPGSGNWPVYIAPAQNFFAGEGLHVTTVMSGSNVATMNLVATGSTNVALDGSDIEIESVAHELPIKIIAPQLHVFTINDPIDFKRDLLAMGELARAAGAIPAVPPIDDIFDSSYLAGAGR